MKTLDQINHSEADIPGLQVAQNMTGAVNGVPHSVHNTVDRLHVVDKSNSRVTVGGAWFLHEKGFTAEISGVADLFNCSRFDNPGQLFLSCQVHGLFQILSQIFD